MTRPTRTASLTALRGLLHLWRVGLLCATLAHERAHPALAVLILVPLNHIFFRLTAGLGGPGSGGAAPSSTSRARLRQPGVVVGLYVLVSIGVVWWYSSVAALTADLKAFSQTGEWWAIVVTVSALTLLYRPLVRALSHLVGATGLHDSRLWTALALAVAVWVWCDGVFAALYQQLSLLCDTPVAPLCQGARPFSQSLARFSDAAYFSTITLSTSGYGDIVPVSDFARAIVSVEIILGFGLLGFLLSRVAGFAPSSKSTGDSGVEPDR
jgi:Ion channel